MNYFSIIIPVYNSQKNILRLFFNIYNQCYKNFEVIIIDDGSTDNSLSIIRKIFPSSTSVFSIKNSGPSYARNYGVERAKYNNIVFLDSDDIWLSNHLANLNRLRDDYPDNVLWCSGYRQISHSSVSDLISLTSLLPKVNEKNLNYSVKKYLLHKLLGKKVFWTSALAIKRSFFIKSGGFNINFSHGEDQAFWLHCVLNGLTVKSSQITSFYVKGENTLSSKLVQDIDAVSNYINKTLTSQSLLIKFLLLELSHRYILSHSLNAYRNKHYTLAVTLAIKAFPTVIYLHKFIYLILFSFSKKITEALYNAN